MNSIALVNRHAPYGRSHAQESLDLLLAMIALEQVVTVFFLDDGVLQLKRQQQPAAIEHKDFTAMFKSLPLYDVTPDQIIVEQQSLQARGIDANDLLLPCQVIDTQHLQKQLYAHQHIISL